MDLQENQQPLENMIQSALNDFNLELETRFLNSKLDNKKFLNCIKKVKGIPQIQTLKPKESLDVFFGNENIRLEINQLENIRKYCKTESINGLNNISFLNKTPINNRYINDYSIKFNLKKETVIPLGNTTINDYLAKWASLDKVYRYKKRYSFKTTDNRFQFDFTLIKSSTKETVRGESTYKKKSEIKDFMKKYVVKPEYVIDFDSWFDKLKSSEKVEMMGRKRDQMIPKKTIKKANVFTNPQEYEIEIEYIGNKNVSNDNKKNVLESFIENIGYILQSLQNNYFIISDREKALVRDGYKKLTNEYQFRGPQSVTLDLSHVLERNYEDYKNILSIRRGYTVTDKADGERNLLIVLNDGKAYLLNRKNDIKSLGCSIPSLSNSILDGEYILKDKEGGNICLYMVFDIYIHNNLDVRDRILMRSEEEKSKLDESRLEILTKIFANLDIVKTNQQSTLKILKKKFYFGDQEDFDDSVNKTIEDNMERLESGNLTEEEEKTVKSSIELLKSDTKIFKESEKVYNKDYIYHIDGLIFTPVSAPVGGGFNPKEKYDLKKQFNGRWNNLFKWKPVEENSIDFLVKIKKDPSNEKEDLISYITHNGNYLKCKTLVLMVGYDPKIHTKHNSLRVMNENVMYSNDYSPTPFQPTNPHIKDIHMMHIPLENDFMKCEDGSIILDESIIECRYDSLNEHLSKWIPMRVREINKPNDFVTAINVWKTINNPISTEMITTGITGDAKDDIYYYKSEKRKDSVTKSLSDFHSYIKKKLITENVSGNMLDLACGKGGDLNHWLDAKDLKSIVCVDVNHDNLESMNGLCNRVLNSISQNDSPLLENILAICADSGKNLLNGKAACDQLSKYYLNIIYGNLDVTKIKTGKLKKFYNLGKDGFDVISVQFALHYFFETKETLDMFLQNVSKSLKTGGKLIGTCLDGSKVFNMLKSQNSVLKYDKSNLLWKIVKKYNLKQFTPDDTSLGQKIDVYFNSIGNTTTEYLVNMDYFIERCKLYDLDLVSMVSFKELYSKSINYGSANMLSSDLMTYSFLNNYFILQKN